MWRHRFWFLFLSVAISASAQALSFSEAFTTSSRIDSTGGAVWNTARGELHPPLLVQGWDDGGGAQDTAFSVGNGQHGGFIESRYATFDSDGVVSGGVIEINTDSWPDLQFTSFHLAAGYTIRPVGSQPLVIRSLSSVLIDGVIDCSGDDGLSAV